MEGADRMSEEKRGQGRPVGRLIEPISATAEEIRDAVFRAVKRKPADSIEETPRGV